VIKGLSSFEFSFHPNFGNWMQFYKAGFKQTTAYTYITPLEHMDGAALLKEMYPRLRNKILNAQQNGYSVQPLSLKDEVIGVLEQTYAVKGHAYPIAIDRLKAFMGVLLAQDALYLSGIYKDNVLAAVLGLVLDNNTAYLIFNGVGSGFSDKGMNELLLFEGMNWAANKGLKRFDFEGSMVPNIESFYRQFGGKLTPYHKIWMESKQRSLRNLKQKLL